MQVLPRARMDTSDELRVQMAQQEVGQVLRSHAQELRACYRFYSAQDEQHVEIAHLGRAAARHHGLLRR